MVAESSHRIETETIIFKEYTEKLEAIDIKFKETIMKEVVTKEEIKKTKEKDLEVQKKLEKAAEKKPEPKMPDFVLPKAPEEKETSVEAAMDDEEERGVVEAAAPPPEPGTEDPEGDQAVKEEEFELKRAVEEAPVEVEAEAKPEPAAPVVMKAPVITARSAPVDEDQAVVKLKQKEKKLETLLKRREKNDEKKIKAILKRKKLTGKQKKQAVKAYIAQRKQSLTKILDKARVDVDDKCCANDTAAALAKRAATEDIYQIIDRSSANKLLMNGKAYISVINAFPKVLKLGQSIDAKPLEMKPLRNTTAYTSMELQLNKQGNSLYYWTFTLGTSDGKGGKSPNAYLRDTPGVFNSLNTDQDITTEYGAEKRKISTSKVNKAQRD